MVADAVPAARPMRMTASFQRRIMVPPLDGGVLPPTSPIARDAPGDRGASAGLEARDPDRARAIAERDSALKSRVSDPARCFRAAPQLCAMTWRNLRRGAAIHGSAA